jgi:lipoyl(octanoyl) transferase
MDLTPYDFINPCGYKGLRVTQLKDFGVDTPPQQIEKLLADQLLKLLAEHHRESSY